MPDRCSVPRWISTDAKVGVLVSPGLHHGALLRFPSMSSFYGVLVRGVPAFRCGSAGFTESKEVRWALRLELHSVLSCTREAGSLGLPSNSSQRLTAKGGSTAGGTGRGAAGKAFLSPGREEAGLAAPRSAPRSAGASRPRFRGPSSARSGAPSAASGRGPSARASCRR